MKNTVEKEFRALGTKIYFQLVLEKNDNEQAAWNDIAKLEKLYLEKQRVLNRFDQNSELSFLNSNLKKFHQASPDIIDLSRKYLEFYEFSNGIFDPRILEILTRTGYTKNFSDIDFSVLSLKPIRRKAATPLEEDLKIEDDKVYFGKIMDFNGIAKGYITDLAAEFLKNRGRTNFLIDSGGDMRLCGLDNKEQKWKISLEGFPENQLMFAISNKAIATSGITRKNWHVGKHKFHHLINPLKPNKYSFELNSVTVMEKNTEKADILAKILFIMGIKKGQKYSTLHNIASIFLDNRNRIWISNKAKEYIL